MSGRPPLPPPTPKIDLTAPPVDIQSEFRAGVTAVLRRWSALRAGVDSGWGGITSHAKAEALRQHLFIVFDGNTRHPTTVNELEDELVVFMDEEFSVVLEDGSSLEVAQIIVDMYQKCCVRDVELARKMVHAAEVEAGNRPAGPVKVMAEGEIDEDSDDDMGGDSETNPPQMVVGQVSLRSSRAEASAAATELAQTYISGELFGSGPPAANTRSLEPQRQLGENDVEKNTDVMVDDDGFATVTRSRKKK
eukprot:CAMPEP_0194267934 /NCGR_PEP_ID=MMETSP0169-20130528/2349_1 /TAXON_ID=218684 /ORGANISM="Corethron pennatum, Strain L29A3" /LENGTH=248 /DNA_ID=CAMNT_0039008967 /DNA_START=27 /DNA_END=773 /DNA_ORIENTATION=-